MSQKVCREYIFHVMAYAFFSEMPQNRTVSIFLQMLHFFMLDFLKCPIFESFEAFKPILISEKNAYAITWKISPPDTFWGINSLGKVDQNICFFNIFRCKLSFQQDAISCMKLMLWKIEQDQRSGKLILD